jgi:signal transduction histidine kinase/CheY-like chemotaxis protein
MFLLLLPWAFAAPGTLQPGWVVDQWTEADGLASDHTFAVARDTLGRVLVGTSDGLSTFNGVRWTTARVGDPAAPPDDRVLRLATAPDGAVWLITESCQLQRRLGDTLTSERLPHPGVVICALHETPVGIFLATELGVMQITDRVRLREDLPRDTAWIGADRGDLLVVSQETTLRQSEPGGPLSPDPAMNEAAAWHTTHAATREAVFQLNDGQVWLGDAPLLGADLRPYAVQAIDDDLWVVTDGFGVLRVRRTPLRVHLPPTPAPPRVDKVLWDPLSAQVLASIGDDAAWWSPAAPGLGATHLAGPDGVRPVPRQGVFPVDVGSRRAWLQAHILVTQRGVALPAQLPVDPTEGPTCASPFLAAVTHPDGSVTTGWGTRFKDGAWTALPGACAAPFDQVRAMLPVPGLGVLMGSPYGLTLLRPDDTVRDLPIPPAARPRHLRVARDHLWMTTEQFGLCVIRIGALLDGTWSCLDRRHGLPETQVHASAEDDLGRLWLSTNRGFLVLDAAEVLRQSGQPQPELAWIRLARDDGLRDPELNGFVGSSFAASNDGRWWFPSQGGLVEVLPTTLDIPLAPDLHVVGAPAGPLPPDHSPVQLQIVASPLRWTEHVALRYRLGDDPWQPTSATLTVPTLPLGRSTLEVQARLIGGWQPGPTLTLTRLPALTERWSVWVSAAAALAAVLAAAVHLRTAALRARAQQLTSLVERQTGALVEQNEALNRQAAELGDRNAVISDQLTRLNEADEVKRRFIADLAHELRTPLTLLRGAIDAARPDVPAARTNASRLHRLIEDLFDLTRLGAGKLPLRARQVELGGFVRQLTARFAPSLRSSGRPLALHLPDAPVEAWADPHLLDMILANLLGNALKHGAGEVRVSLRRAADHAVLEVQDDGPGVPPADRDRVFERFVQLSDGDTRAHEGAGIGLALVRELAELHGGEATVLDGARFQVRLPLGQAHLLADDIDLASPRQSPPPPAAADGDLLLIEDNDELRDFMVGLLTSRWTVTTARNGREALDVLRHHRPRAILSDIRMPEMDGLAFGRALRADARIADLPLLYVSAKTQHEDRAAGLVYAQAYLCKPFGAADLLDAVAALLGDDGPEPEHVAAWREALRAATDAHLASPDFGVAELARKLGVSVRTLQERMKELNLPTPAAWLLEARLTVAQGLLQRGAYATVGEVAAAVGLSRAYFTRAYRAWSGHPPGDDAA